MASHSSSPHEIIPGKFPKFLKNPLAILSCSAPLALFCLAPMLRAAPQSQVPPPPPSAQKPADNSSPDATRPALRVVQQMVQVDIIAKDHDGKPVQNLKQS